MSPYRSAARLCMLVVVSTLFACAAHAPTPAYVTPSWIHETPAPRPPRFLGYNASSAFYDNERATGHYWVTDPIYGAKCDGTTNDAAAITAADVAASVNFGEVDFPGGVCGVSTTVGPSAGALWRGLSASNVNSPVSVIRAIGAMTAVLTVNVTSGNNTVGPTPAYLTHLTIDGNRPNCPNCATYGINALGDWGSTYDNLTVVNATTDLIHRAQHILPLTVSSVTNTVPGGSPTGLVLTQPDTTYAGNFPISPSTAANLVVKVATTAALGTATLVLSQDGGSTFATFSQLIASTTNLCQSQGAACLYASGIQIAFPAGTYHAGDTYAFTVRAQEQYAINSWTKTHNIFGRYAGTAYVSAGLSRATYAGSLGFSAPGVLNDAYTAPGTVTATAGSEIIVGTGTTFISGASLGRVARTGDSFFLKCGASVNTNLYPIAVVLDDTHIAIPPNNPLPTCAGSDYAINVGAGFFEVDSGDYSGTVIEQGIIENVPTGFRGMGDGADGAEIHGLRIEANYTAAAFSFGGIVVQTNNAEATHDLLAKGSNMASNTVQYYMAALSVITMYDSHLIGADSIRGPGFARIFKGGYDYIYPSGISSQATLTPVNNWVLNSTLVPLTAGNQVIPAPNTDPTIGFNTSYIELQPNANYLGFTGTPEFAAPTQTGQIIVIRNYYSSGKVIEFFDRTTFSLSGLSLSGGEVAMWPGEEMLCRAATQSGTNGWWSCGEVSRSAEGLFSTSSGDGHSSGYVQSTGTAPVAIVQWDFTFSTTHGMLVDCNVTAEDTNLTDHAEWNHVKLMIRAGGGFNGSKTIGEVRGSNSGGTPTGWTDPFFINSGGMLLLQFNGVAAHTIVTKAQCEQSSLPKF